MSIKLDQINLIQFNINEMLHHREFTLKGSVRIALHLFFCAFVDWTKNSIANK